VGLVAKPYLHTHANQLIWAAWAKVLGDSSTLFGGLAHAASLRPLPQLRACLSYG
jgi:hypothetical protein